MALLFIQLVRSVDTLSLIFICSIFWFPWCFLNCCPKCLVVSMNCVPFNTYFVYVVAWKVECVVEQEGLDRLWYVWMDLNDEEGRHC